MNTRTTSPNRLVRLRMAALAAVAFAILPSTPALAVDGNDEFKFELVSSSPNILPHAHGRVRIESVGPVEIMNVTVWGLPPNTDFDFFVIQVPRAPFGLSWYQGEFRPIGSVSVSAGLSGGLMMRPLSWRPEPLRRRPSHRPPISGCEHKSSNATSSNLSPGSLV